MTHPLRVSKTAAAASVAVLLLALLADPASAQIFGRGRSRGHGAAEPIVARFDPRQADGLDGAVTFTPVPEQRAIGGAGRYSIGVDLDFRQSRAVLDNFCGFPADAAPSFLYHIHVGWAPGDTIASKGLQCTPKRDVGGHWDPNFACSPDSHQLACKSGPGGTIDPTFRAWGRSSAGEYECGSPSWLGFRNGQENLSAQRLGVSRNLGAALRSAFFLAGETGQCELGDLSGKFGELKLPARGAGDQVARFSVEDVFYSLPRADAIGFMAGGSITPDKLPFRAVPDDPFPPPGVAGPRSDRRSVVVHCGAGSAPEKFKKPIACAGLFPRSALPAVRG